MHSRIFEIKAKPIKDDEWASEIAIADDDYRIDGVDYFQKVKDADERVEDIENFFLKWFPNNSFKIIKNEPGKTAVVKFVGDINALYEDWRNQIQDAARNISEKMSSMELWALRNALNEPFDLSTKFYQEEWNGCTVSADDFLGYLRYLDEKSGGKHFKLYVGQVFDYHF